jgi:hypothetical protein
MKEGVIVFGSIHSNTTCCERKLYLDYSTDELNNLRIVMLLRAKSFSLEHKGIEYDYTRKTFLSRKVIFYNTYLFYPVSLK